MVMGVRNAGRSATLPRGWNGSATADPGPVRISIAETVENIVLEKEGYGKRASAKQP
jgi:hypothetical protein